MILLTHMRMVFSFNAQMESLEESFPGSLFTQQTTLKSVFDFLPVFHNFDLSDTGSFLQISRILARVPAPAVL